MSAACPSCLMMCVSPCAVREVEHSESLAVYKLIELSTCCVLNAGFCVQLIVTSTCMPPAPAPARARSGAVNVAARRREILKERSLAAEAKAEAALWPEQAAARTNATAQAAAAQTALREDEPAALVSARQCAVVTTTTRPMDAHLLQSHVAAATVSPTKEPSEEGWEEPTPVSRAAPSLPSRVSMPISEQLEEQLSPAYEAQWASPSPEAHAPLRAPAGELWGNQGSSFAVAPRAGPPPAPTTAASSTVDQVGSSLQTSALQTSCC